MADCTTYRLLNGVVHEYPADKSVGLAIAHLKSLGQFAQRDCVRAIPQPDGTVVLVAIPESERRDW